MIFFTHFDCNLLRKWRAPQCVLLLLLLLLFESFSHQRYLMVLHWSLNDSKSPQVFRTFLSILADLNNAIVWMVTTRFFISKSSSSCTYPLVTYRARWLQLVSPSLSCSIVLFFRVGTYLSFRFPSALSSGQPERQSPLFSMFSFFGWLPLGLVICLRLFLLLWLYSLRVCHDIFNWCSLTGVTASQLKYSEVFNVF